MAALGNQKAMLVQYTQKQRKPLHGPKSFRVHRYSPPVPGYFAVRVATAMASGTMKSNAASSHKVTDPGPACAAAGIQRVPTMHVMVNRVTSRSPSSRRKPVAGWGSATSLLSPELFADPAQALGKKLRLAAQPHAQETLQTQMRAGHDEHALVHANLLAELVTRLGRIVTHQAQRAGLGVRSE